ncbi:hypothetical protein [uncultured Paracoccus sp.]|uniref:hypothetical protein n=1 Tax=uncultured Paracoccus sp. TaxID=189685 RepID=UPI0025D1236A|nr:hypothetical protein [uncultured Paracoccus sp.]
MIPASLPRDAAEPVESELQMMRAIIANCLAMGLGQDAANRMAVRSILNLRQARPLP